jgi:hypothetical protein
VSDVTLIYRAPVNWSHSNFFTLSTVPIRKLEISYGSIEDMSLAPFALIFPSLTHLKLNVTLSVRKSFY